MLERIDYTRYKLKSKATDIFAGLPIEDLLFRINEERVKLIKEIPDAVNLVLVEDTDGQYNIDYWVPKTPEELKLHLQLMEENKKTMRQYRYTQYLNLKKEFEPEQEGE